MIYVFEMPKLLQYFKQDCFPEKILKFFLNCKQLKYLLFAPVLIIQIHKIK